MFGLMFASAAVFRALAAAAGAHVELEAVVLWFAAGGLLELHDDVVTVAFGQLGLAHEHVTLLLKCQRRFARLGIRDDVTFWSAAGTGFMFAS